MAYSITRKGAQKRNKGVKINNFWRGGIAIQNNVVFLKEIRAKRQ